MKTTRKTLILLTAMLTIGFTLTGMFTSCDVEEMGMNDPGASYSYRASSTDFDYQEAVGPFDTAIRLSVGLDPILGGNDDKVIEACDACYDNLKQKNPRMSGKVIILKIRHPEGKQMVLKKYRF